MSTYSLVISSKLECTGALSIMSVGLALMIPCELQCSINSLIHLLKYWPLNEPRDSSSCEQYKLAACHGSYKMKICSMANIFGSALLSSTVEVIICLIDTYQGTSSRLWIEKFLHVLRSFQCVLFPIHVVDSWPHVHVLAYHSTVELGPNSEIIFMKRQNISLDRKFSKLFDGVCCEKS